MAIRPVDLQLAYMAAPQNAAAISSAEDAPQAAQQAAQAAFAAELVHRQESIDEPVHVEGAKVRARDERDPDARGDTSGGRRGRRAPHPPASGDSPLGLAGDGEHFIDVTA
jgi:hypothetical protein